MATRRSKPGAGRSKKRGKKGAGKGKSKSGPPKGRNYDGFILKGNTRYDRHDHYYRQAKADGYVARSIYKLEEIDKIVKLIRAGDNVLDLGCAPGSWMQYAERRVHEKGGLLVGIDLLPTAISFGPHVRIIEGDAFETTAEELLPATFSGKPTEAQPFDVVLSDMAPNTTGVRPVDQARSMALVERALDLSVRLLRPGGRFCVKVFEGGDMPAFIKRCREVFETVKIRRPKGVRIGSMETYVVGLNKKRVTLDVPDARGGLVPTPRGRPVDTDDVLG